MRTDHIEAEIAKALERLRSGDAGTAIEHLHGALSGLAPEIEAAAPRYGYATLRAEDVVAMFVRPREPGSYISRDRTADAVEALLAAGYRWVRTDGQWAVFERREAGSGHQHTEVESGP